MVQSQPKAEAVDRGLQSVGLHLKPEWIQERLQQILPQKLVSLEDSALVQEIFRQAIGADLKVAGRPCLPENLPQLHKTSLKGRLVLQLESIANIGHAHDERLSHFNDHRRTLLLEVTDGHVLLPVLELERCRELDELLQKALDPANPQVAGKLVLQGEPEIRRGMVVIRPHNIKLLGGWIPAPADPNQPPPKTGSVKNEGVKHEYGDGQGHQQQQHQRGRVGDDSDGDEFGLIGDIPWDQVDAAVGAAAGHGNNNNQNNSSPNRHHRSRKADPDAGDPGRAMAAWAQDEGSGGFDDEDVPLDELMAAEAHMDDFGSGGGGDKQRPPNASSSTSSSASSPAPAFSAAGGGSGRGLDLDLFGEGDPDLLLEFNQQFDDGF